MDEIKKKLIVGPDDVKVENGKLIISSSEVANAIENQEFSLDGEEGSNAISVTLTIGK